MSTSTLLISLFKYKAWANAELFAGLGKLDPVLHQSERHTAIRLLNHIHVVDSIFAAHLAGQPPANEGTNTPETPTFEALGNAVSTSDRWYIEYVGNVPSDRLAERVSFTFTDAQVGTMSREEMLAHVITHGGYHRGAVGRIMAQLSITPPRDTFTVYLHQSEPQRRAST